MTRGTLLYLTPDKVLESTEFNGDMYPDGRGDDTFFSLMTTETEGDFSSVVRGINESGYEYEGQLIWTSPLEEIAHETEMGELVIDFGELYFERLSSDWIFVKNMTGEDIKVYSEDKSRNIFELKDGYTSRFKFGNMGNYSFKFLSDTPPELLAV